MFSQNKIIISIYKYCQLKEDIKAYANFYKKFYLDGNWCKIQNQKALETKTLNECFGNK